MASHLAFTQPIPVSSARQTRSSVTRAFHPPVLQASARPKPRLARLHYRTAPQQIPTAHRPPTPTPSPQSPRKAPLRNALFALLAAAATFLPTRPAPTYAGSTSDTTVARAVPSRSSLSRRDGPATIRVKPQTPSSEGHGLAGTSFAVAGSAALLASALAVAVTHPIDTLKTMRQARASGRPTGPITLHSLYRGVLSNIIKEAPNAAIYLGTYEVFKACLLRIPAFASAPLAAMCVAGMLGDAVGSVVRVPAEIINKRLQLGLNDGWASAIQEAFLSENGVQGTFASWLAVLWRDVPYGGLQIAGYEFVRLVLARWGFTGLAFSVVAGAVAGLFAAVVTTPADVLVTRMSTQSPQCYLETRQYMSPSATLRRILREEGFPAVWTGAMHRGLFYMPMIGLFFCAYECFKSAIMNPVATRLAIMNVAGSIIGTLSAGVPLAVGLFQVPLQVALMIAAYGFFRNRKSGGASSVKP